MRTFKAIIGAASIALTLMIADTNTTQAKPSESFQRIVVRTGRPGYYQHHREMRRRMWRRHHRRMMMRRGY